MLWNAQQHWLPRGTTRAGLSVHSPPSRRQNPFLSSSTDSSADGSSGGFGSFGGTYGHDYGPDTGGISSAVVAGISVASVVCFFALVGLGIWLCLRRRRRRRQLQQQNQHHHLADRRDAHNVQNAEDAKLAPDASLHSATASQHDHNAAVSTPSATSVPLPSQPEIRTQQTLDDDPPTYEESSSAALARDYARGAVPDGFRRYSTIPPVASTKTTF